MNLICLSRFYLNINKSTIVNQYSLILHLLDYNLEQGLTILEV